MNQEGKRKRHQYSRYTATQHTQSYQVLELNAKRAHKQLVLRQNREAAPSAEGCAKNRLRIWLQGRGGKRMHAPRDFKYPVEKGPSDLSGRQNQLDTGSDDAVKHNASANLKDCLNALCQRE